MKKILMILFFVLLCSNSIMAQRINTTMNAGWRFHEGDIQAPVTNIHAEEWRIINLPHTWNDQDAFDETPDYYRGVCWYVKELPVPQEWKGKTVVLYFEGANQKAEVFLNGKPLGNHVGGYTAFSFDMSKGLKYGDMNTVAVKLDNAHDENIPPLRADFTFYGGIYRNVSVIVSEPIHFDFFNNASDGVFVETPSVNEQNALVKVLGSIANDTAIRKNVIIETAIIDKNNQVVAKKATKLRLPPNSKTDFSIEKLKIQSPKLWHPDHPYLYQAITQIKEDAQAAPVLDQMVLPVGLRWYEFDQAGGFMLNGKPLKLVGANRHQDFEDLGNALSDAYHFNDYKKIKEMGFNFIRTAHYPQAPEVYRVCDELGLLVWSEIPVVSSITDSEAFAQNSLNMQREHIRQTRNHPSVIFYGYMNEVLLGLQYNRSLSDTERQQALMATVDLAKKLEALTKMEAPDHYTVMALHNSPSYNESGLADIPDVVGWNLYFGWYYQNIDDLTTFLAEQHATYPKRPMIVSEYGPGADVRIHAKTPVPWDFSEEYQYVLHASYLKQMMNMPYLAGFAVWNFADFGSERRNDTIPFVNQKGLVNFDRTEKDVCGLYRAYFLSESVVHIASHHNTHRAGIEQSAGTGICLDSIKVFSNQKTIELILNGKTLGQKPVKDHEVNFEVPFKEGKNVLKAVDESGHLDQVVINYTMIPFHLDAVGVKALAINVGSDVSFYDPKTKVLWIPDRKYTPKTWGYVGGEPYATQRRQRITGISQNVLGTEMDPVFQTFVEGIKNYRFDVPDGQYKLTLCFQEYITRTRQNELINNLSTRDSAENTAEAREFDIAINGKNVVKKLNLERDYGRLRAVTLDFVIDVENGTGIQTDFSPTIGKTLLSGIRISSHP